MGVVNVINFKILFNLIIQNSSAILGSGPGLGLKKSRAQPSRALHCWRYKYLTYIYLLFLYSIPLFYSIYRIYYLIMVTTCDNTYLLVSTF